MMDPKKALWGLYGEILGYSWGNSGRMGDKWEEVWGIIGVLRENWGEIGVGGCEGGSKLLLLAWIAFCFAVNRAFAVAALCCA